LGQKERREIPERNGKTMSSRDLFLCNLSGTERGDAALLKNHLRRYVPYFLGKKQVVDLGCGNGEFLELLKEEKIGSLGVEENPTAAAGAKKRGLRVVRKKIQPFLRGCRAGSVGGFFMSHVIEHLQPPDAMEVLAQIHKALKPGGILVLVTPNPLSVGVMTQSFWRDPTHVRPYPSDFLAQYLESLSFHVLEMGETCLGAQPSLLRRCARKVRTLLVGDYFRDPDSYLAAQKKES
jgi:SAM-dependent methyltransferase